MNEKRLAVVALLCLSCGGAPMSAASAEDGLALRVANVSVERLKTWSKGEFS